MVESQKARVHGKTLGKLDGCNTWAWSKSLSLGMDGSWAHGHKKDGQGIKANQMHA